MTRGSVATTALLQDTRMMKDAITVSIAMMLRSSATLGLGMCMMAWVSWHLTALVLTVLPLIIGSLM